MERWSGGVEGGGFGVEVAGDDGRNDARAISIYQLSSRAKRGICIFAADYGSLASLGMTNLYFGIQRKSRCDLRSLDGVDVVPQTAPFHLLPDSHANALGNPP